MSAFLIDVEGPDYELSVEKYLSRLDILKTQVKNFQLLVDMADEDVRGTIGRLGDSLFLSRQSHQADLIWILAELNGVLLHWGEDDNFDAGVAKSKVQYLITTINEKFKENSE